MEMFIKSYGLIIIGFLILLFLTLKSLFEKKLSKKERDDIHKGFHDLANIVQANTFCFYDVADDLERIENESDTSEKEKVAAEILKTLKDAAPRLYKKNKEGLDSIKKIKELVYKVID